MSKEGKNIFFDAKAKNSMSEVSDKFVTGILCYANDLCLLMNPSVNAYRRLDPKYEAPNEIKVSSVDRGAMVRIPIGNEKSARIEVRTVAPDVNPYLCLYGILKAGLEGINAPSADYAKMKKKVTKKVVDKLPGDIYSAICLYRESKFMKDMLGNEDHEKYAHLKELAADRCPRELGTRVKAEEVIYHHEITNQLLWSDF